MGSHVPVQLLDLFRRVALAEVDGDATNLLRLLKTFRNTVDDVHGRCATQNSGVGRHQTHGACAKDGDRFTRAEPRELDAMPAL